MRILILGAGALGSNLAKVLLPDLRGEHEIEVLDFDTVEERNVTPGTQFYATDQIGLSKVEALQFNLFKFYGQEIKIHHCRFPAGFSSDISGYDWAIDCFDNHESRQNVQRLWEFQSNVKGHYWHLIHAGFSDQFTFAIENALNYKVPTDIEGLDICELPGAASFVNMVASATSWVLQNAIKTGTVVEMIGNQNSFKKY